MENVKVFVGVIGIISILVVCSFPFVLIWHSLEIAIKILLTGISGALVTILWAKIIKSSEKDIKKGES